MTESGGRRMSLTNEVVTVVKADAKLFKDYQCSRVSKCYM